MTVLVAHAGRHGATEGIARFIATTLKEEGREALARPVAASIHPRGFDAVVLGSAVYYGSWMREATEFALSHRDALAEVPVWLFSSGPLGAEVEDADEQPLEVAELRRAFPVKDHRIFYGMLDPANLTFGERMAVKAMRAPAGDFRDWDDIRSWAKGIAADLR